MMGISGIVLKKKENIDIDKTINDIKSSVIESGLKFRIGKEEFENGDGFHCYFTVDIANTFETDENQQKISLYVYSTFEDESDDEYSWHINGERLIEIINIENLHNSEKVLLDFLYEYMRLNPDDVFWDEMRWFYRFQDIMKSHERIFDKEWCYKEPAFWK